MSHDNLLPVTQLLRCYIEEPREKKEPAGEPEGVAETEDATALKAGGAEKSARIPSAAEIEINSMIRLIDPTGVNFHLVFDTETETDPGTGMRLRFGVYQIRGASPEDRKAIAKKVLARTHARGLPAPHEDDLQWARKLFNTLHDSGIFYNDKTSVSDGIAILREIAHERGMKVFTWGEWLERVFIGSGEFWHSYWSHKEGYSLAVGHNLVFDLSTIATREGYARGKEYNGFSNRVCACEWATTNNVLCPDHPHIIIKQFAPGKNKIRWKVPRGASKKIRQKRGFRKDRNIKNRKFLDTKTLARALLGPGDMSLEALTKTLGCKTRKVRSNSHGDILTCEYVEYAINDVQSTWEVYEELRELYRLHGVSRDIWTIMSEASLGAAYLSDMGVQGILKNHDIPKDVLAKFMETFCGGRSEVIIRLIACYIAHYDAKSQYPTVNRLMRLQDFLIAKEIEVRRNSLDTVKWFASVLLSAFQEKTLIDGVERWPAWERLRGIARVRPRGGDILPVRGDYAADGMENIALPYIDKIECGDGTMWVTFSDVIGSRLLTGKPVEVLETIELIPHGRIETEPKMLFGKPEYTIDLAKNDLFQRLIDLRDKHKAERDDLKEKIDSVRKAGGEPDSADVQRYEFLDQLQLALKLLANATSYGKLVEFRVEEMDVDRTCYAYIRDEVKKIVGRRTEHPGAYFAPFGTLIPAAGRFMLAIVEVLAREQGLRHVLCDTDGMTLKCPDDMPLAEFQERLNRVFDWFAAINPYQDKSKARGSVFQDEHPASERLRCLAVSAKRYMLYQRGPVVDGWQTVTPVKISAHGLASFWDPPGYKSQYADAPDEKTIRKLVKTQTAPVLSYDIWRYATELVENGKSVPTEFPWLSGELYIDQAHVGTAKAAKLYDGIEGMRSFTFFSVVPHLIPRAFTEMLKARKDERLRHMMESGFYAREASRVEDIRYELRFRDTGEPANITGTDLETLHFQTIEYRLRNYFRHPEATAWPAGEDAIGPLERRHVVIERQAWIGKETDVDDEDPDVWGDERLHEPRIRIDDGHIWQSPGHASMFEGISLHELSKRTGYARSRLRKYRTGKLVISQRVCKRIRAEIQGMERKTNRQSTSPKPKPAASRTCGT
jgi:hypothetical protein